jgi:hypothetical protein
LAGVALEATTCNEGGSRSGRLANDWGGWVGAGAFDDDSGGEPLAGRATVNENVPRGAPEMRKLVATCTVSPGENAAVGTKLAPLPSE